MKTSIEQDNAGFRVLAECGLLSIQTIDKDTLSYSGHIPLVSVFELAASLAAKGIDDIIVLDTLQIDLYPDIDFVNLSISLAP